MPRRGMAIPSRVWLCPRGFDHARVGARRFGARNVGNLADELRPGPAAGQPARGFYDGGAAGIRVSPRLSLATRMPPF
jgi:hypothetical protein